MFRSTNKGNYSRKTQARRGDRSLVGFHRGHRLKVPNHPVEFCSQPWFPLTVRMNNPNGIIDAGALYNAMVAQLAGLNFTLSLICIRLSRVRVWGPIPTTNTPLVMRVYDLFDEIAGSTPAGNLVLEEITDYADQVNRARVGYSFSTAQQQKSLLVTSGSNDRLVALGGAGAGSVAYWTLLWRPFPQGLPPAVKTQAVPIKNRNVRKEEWDDDFDRMSLQG